MAPSIFRAKNNLRQRGYKRPYQGRYYGQYVPLAGQGGFWGDVWKGARKVGGAVGRSIKRSTPRGTFSRIGTAAGGALGAMSGNPALGATLGGIGGDMVSKLAGFGDYNVVKNSLMKGGKLDEGSPIPVFGDLKHATTIAHREFIGNVVCPASPAAFTVVSYPLNPGIQGTFPWLSAIAENYDQYQVLGMVVEYRSTSSQSATASALGSIMLGTEYDVSHPDYKSKLEMANSQYSMSGAPTQNILHPIECDPQLHPNALLNIRYENESADLRWYDWGRFQIATEGLAATAGDVIGELYISYQVALYKPSLAESRFNLRAASFQLNNPVATASYMGTSNTPSVNNTLDCVLSGSTITIPARTIPGGDYFTVALCYAGASTVLTNALTFGALSNCISTNDVFSGWNFFAPVAGVTSDETLIFATFKLTDNSLATTVTLTAGTLPTSITAARCIVSRMFSFA